jgi:hypothetical protein
MAPVSYRRLHMNVGAVTGSCFELGTSGVILRKRCFQFPLYRQGTLVHLQSGLRTEVYVASIAEQNFPILWYRYHIESIEFSNYSFEVS